MTSIEIMKDIELVGVAHQLSYLFFKTIAKSHSSKLNFMLDKNGICLGHTVAVLYGKRETVHLAPI